MKNSLYELWIDGKQLKLAPRLQRDPRYLDASDKHIIEEIDRFIDDSRCKVEIRKVK